jgi:hypothetical protein
MILIAHRGNFEGTYPETENTYKQIRRAWKKGFDVEVDVWWIEGQFYLGHDIAKHPIDPAVLTDYSMWCHAKTPGTLKRLMDLGAHCFFIDQDECTLTSENFLWTSPNGELTRNSIAVMPEYSAWTKKDLKHVAGICSDNLILRKK